MRGARHGTIRLCQNDVPGNGSLLRTRRAQLPLLCARGAGPVLLTQDVNVLGVNRPLPGGERDHDSPTFTYREKNGASSCDARHTSGLAPCAAARTDGRPDSSETALLAGDRPPRSRDPAVIGQVYALTEERLSSFGI
jgi:hypothetical protein